jgi:hypothetical protein
MFRIIIGAIFVAEYFVGFDGHGKGAHQIMILLFGVAFVGYGLFQFASKAR